MKEIENNRYCSMIEDLLPLYVENLVSEDTKKEIEEHIKKCNKCSEELKKISQDEGFNLNKQVQEEFNKETKEKETEERVRKKECLMFVCLDAAV